MQGTSKQIRRAFRYAFPHTIPIFAGFWFLGITYGVYMNVSGFSFVYPMLMSMTIFTGSMEFVTVNMLLSGFHPLQAFVMAILVGARHLFYGISMLDKFRGMGWKKFFLIYGMCDETFSINYSAEIPENVDRGWFMFFVTVLNYSYWVTGATFGGLFGSLIHFNTQGLDFAMTAMFVVIFMEQWMKDKKHTSQFVGLGASVLCLVIFGADSFMVPTMFVILFFLTVLRKKERRSGHDGFSADYHHCHYCRGHGIDALFAISDFSGGKTDAELHPVPWKGAACGCIWHDCHLLPAQC